MTSTQPFVQSPTDLHPSRRRPPGRVDELIASSQWVFHLDDDQVAELEALGAQFLADDPDLRFVRADDFPLAACADAVTEWAADLDNGRGFVLVRGLRTERYSDSARRRRSTTSSACTLVSRCRRTTSAI